MSNSPALGADSTTNDVMSGVDMSGKFAVITGGSGGLGYETARALLAAGSDVFLGARTPDKLTASVASLQAAYPGRFIGAVPLDLAELDSVDRFADEVLALDRPIDLMIANAGIMACPLERNSQGVELQLATNYVGHAALISRIVSAILKSKDARVIALTSSGHHFSDVRLDDLNFEAGDYDKWLAYGQSKTASSLLAMKVHKALSGQGVTALAVHPGFIQTDLMRHLNQDDYLAMRERTDIELPTTRTYKTVEQGAATTLYAATTPGLKGTFAYLEDCGIARKAERRDTLHGVMPWASDQKTAEELWRRVEALSGRSLPLA